MPDAAPAATPPVAATDSSIQNPGVAPVAAALPTPAPAASATPVTEEPAWLKDRLERAKTSAEAAVLKQLGVKDVASAKAVLDAQKTEMQRLIERTAELEPEAAKARLYGAALKERADVELSQLTPEQRAAVTKVAGDEPHRVLTTIDAFKPVWLTPVAAAPPAAAPVPKPVPAPAGTTPPASPPPAAAGVSSEVNHKAVYESIKERNPLQAAGYLLAHQSQIYPDK